MSQASLIPQKILLPRSHPLIPVRLQLQLLHRLHLLIHHLLIHLLIHLQIFVLALKLKRVLPRKLILVLGFRLILIPLRLLDHLLRQAAQLLNPFLRQLDFVRPVAHQLAAQGPNHFHRHLVLVALVTCLQTHFSPPSHHQLVDQGQ